MGDLDGWAIVIGDNVCRYFSRNGHDIMEGIFCSDGSYSAGWRLVAAALGLGIMGFVFFKFLRPGP